ncbi:N-acetylmuramoyl-L-alanine amidase [Shewanella sp. 202IG2-18]|uniref:N-acetylmuramoyl-L-alanine amidase n=1 Tax=Parashewanella hymeniacidonis TaxID=2807618 RepID=UPI0019611610|nr:N-acetylmuramoyl-L-alanine amidase [Parashewanella hymeniacidonis]MBM7071600.1 N-acetylmuramoyl-L-alanine amidase [Parashewanella hymeniacidonis]
MPNRALIKRLLIVFIFLLPIHSALANTLQGVRIWAAPDSTRIVFDLSDNPQYSYFFLAKPDRLVVDLKGSKSKLSLSKVKNSSKLIKRVRYSKTSKKNTLRVVLDLTKPVSAKIFSLKPTKPYGDRLVIDIETKGKSSTVKVVTKPKKKLRDIIIAIDPGHGGDDPGSIGPAGTYEKKVVLQIAKRTQALINKVPGMKAILTRRGDYFVTLNGRTEIARNKKVDLLVSIHADAFTTPKPRGASVWLVSKRRAKSEMGRWLEQKERHSELLGGAGDAIENTDSEQYLAMTLIDMVSDKSLAISHQIADGVLGQVGRVTKLHKRHPESASFGVLKSPDIPSLLVETGFISNPQEERLLRSTKHQQKLANAIKTGIVSYFKKHAPSDTLIANHSAPKIHKVKRGDSLTRIARRYNVSVARIKKANNLKSDVVRLGQRLTIPRT